MFVNHYLGWVRDEKGKVLSRPVKHIANAVTTMVWGGAYRRGWIGQYHAVYLYHF